MLRLPGLRLNLQNSNGSRSSAASTAGVTRGCNPPVNDRFCPGSNVTRGQMAAFLHRAWVRRTGYDFCLARLDIQRKLIDNLFGQRVSRLAFERGGLLLTITATTGAVAAMVQMDSSTGVDGLGYVVEHLLVALQTETFLEHRAAGFPE